MPNMEQVKQASARREARKAAREAAVETAHEQTAKLSETATAARKEAAAAAPKPKIDRHEAKRAARAEAEAEVLRQARTMKVDRPDPTDYLGRNRSGRVPLHVLNAAAQKVSNATRDKAREAASAAGKAVYDVATSLNPPSLRAQVNRHARVLDAQERMRRAKERQAAHEAKADE